MITSRRTRAVYYLYRMTNSAGFYVPVAILFLTDQGFSLSFIGFSYAVFAVATVTAEIPTGYLGDRVGRRGSLAIGAGLRAGVLAAYPLVETAGAYLCLHVAWAVGRTFKSGTVDAWLYELLAEHGEEASYALVESRGKTALLVTSAVTAVAGGLLYGVAPGLPFFANAGLAALGLPLLWIAPQARSGKRSTDAESGTTTPGGHRFTVSDAGQILRAQVERPSVRWLVVYLGLLYAVFGVTRIYEQPALDAVGVSVTSLGLLYAAFKLISAGAAASVGWLESSVGTRRLFALLVPAYGLAYASIAFVPALVLPVLFLNRGLHTIITPLRNQYLNDRLDDVGRATVLSGVAMAMALASAAARILAGWVVVWTGPLVLLAVVGVVLPATAGLVWVGTMPVRTDTSAVGPETDGHPAD